MNRRSFLKSFVAGSGLILAAPAIVKAESLMKLYVPKQTLAPDLDIGSIAFQGINWQRPGLTPPESIPGNVYYNTFDKTVYCFTGQKWLPLIGVPHAT